ncbi:zonular occludens toxin domain-containing protein [Variovorax sp. Varisp41]|uniref:zonular occludens toxin domain-containing protein n=1 Tax=Variovorax sp. Varisp41 TaxID=3243033 RepID=UPI0039B5B8DD
MINGLEGIPGSGKSYEASVFQALAALKSGRKIITNLPLVIEAFAAIEPAYRDLIEMRYAPAPVRGTWVADRIDPATGKGQAFQLFEDGRTEPPSEGARPFGTVWCYWSDWKHPETGHGPLFLVDECHVPMPRLGTQKDVMEWYKLHRHFNCDVMLMTQVFRKMCPDIAELMGMVIKVRKADVLGRPDEYIRKVHAGYRGAVIQESIRKYEPQFFQLYVSHTQGNAVLESGAADVAPLSVKLKRWSWAVYALTAVAVVTAVVLNMGDKKKPGKEVAHRAPVSVAQAAYPVGSGMAAQPVPVREAPAPLPAAEKAPVGAPAAPKGDPEPFAGKAIHLTGMMRLKGRVVYSFALSASGAVFAQITSDDLVAAGYTWDARGDCVGYLRWRGDARAVICDAPVRQAGSPDKPIVMNGGYSSDGRIVPPSHQPEQSSPRLTTM